MDGTCPLQERLHENFLNNLRIIGEINEPCAGFVNKYSCGCDCKHYTCKINKLNIQMHYCDKEHIPKNAFIWMRKVGCRLFDNGTSE